VVGGNNKSEDILSFIYNISWWVGWGWDLGRWRPAVISGGVFCAAARRLLLLHSEKEDSIVVLS
jgi:hypothetical protein